MTATPKITADVTGTPLSPTVRKQALAEQPPLIPHSDLRQWRSTIVFAPHPDDEALGCGGLLTLLRQRDLDVHVVFVSDGAMSHPNSRRYDRRARVALREAEALAACAVLGVPNDRVYFFRYPDTAVPRVHQPGFEAAVARTRQLLVDLAPSHLLVSWRRDPHGDHRASWEICQAAYALLPPDARPTWVEYPIWMWNSDREEDLPRPGEVIAWRLDVSEVLRTKERAVRCHVSQLTDLIDDDPAGFTLSKKMLAHFQRPTELYFERADKRQHSLGPDYFVEVYDAAADPWSFETNPYEHAKYEHTLAALTQSTYRSAFEIGCSIGVLTQRLAPRCARLLAVDIADRPLAVAARRLTDQPHVEFRRMELPGDFPSRPFDLIVCSEVGYYWSEEDLQTAIGKIGAALLPGGQLLLVHFTPYVPDYPLTGDEVHDAFRRLLPREFNRLRADRADRYRLDLYQKRGGAANS